MKVYHISEEELDTINDGIIKIQGMLPDCSFKDLEKIDKILERMNGILNTVYQERN